MGALDDWLAPVSRRDNPLTSYKAEASINEADRRLPKDQGLLRVLTKDSSEQQRKGSKRSTS